MRIHGVLLWCGSENKQFAMDMDYSATSSEISPQLFTANHLNLELSF